MGGSRALGVGHGAQLRPRFLWAVMTVINLIFTCVADGVVIQNVN